MLPTCFPQLPTPQTKKWVHVMVSISSLGPAVQPQVWISPVQIHYLTRFLTVTDLILYLGKSFPDSVQFLLFCQNTVLSMPYFICRLSLPTLAVLTERTPRVICLDKDLQALSCTIFLKLLILKLIQGHGATFYSDTIHLGRPSSLLHLHPSGSPKPQLGL